MDNEMLRAAVRLVITLPLVAVMAYVAIKYGLARRGPGMFKTRRMRLVEQMPLGPKTSLSIVQVGDRYFLLAHQDGSTVLITEMEELPAVIDSKQTSVPYRGLSTLAGKLTGRETGSHEK